MSTEQLQILIDKYLDESLSSREHSRLAEMLTNPEYAEQFKSIIAQELSARHFELEPDAQLGAAIKSFVAEHIELQNESLISVPPTHRVHFLRRGFFRYAAAIIITIGLGTVAYLLTTDRNHKQTLANDNKRLQTDIPPGGEKAILTLADGTKIVLDEAANGQLANQGGVQVVKLANGQIAYDVKGLTDKDVMWNTMSTPVGGQYRVTLPDGTKVWLNAASSITYPAAFVSNKRQVKITGEVYFEVAKNKARPFLVDIDGKSLIEVLGTSFNVNSYQDEGSIRATLLEGSIKFSGGATTALAASSDRQPKSSRIGDFKSIILKPGQQASTQIDGLGQIQVINNADIEKALAWKNGLFNFNGSDLYIVMRQLERWYDIKVKYESKIPDVKFKGEMSRGVKLSTIRNWFSELGINTKLEGKTLIVL